jgi:predicted phosphodiesterase
MRLWAFSDLHVGYRENRRLIEELPGAPGDWLVLAGDLCETLADLDFVLGTLGPRFGRLVWVPGNHELWTTSDPARGVAKYERCVALCRSHGVLTPEDEYQVFPGAGGGHLVVPLFTLYDYSFCPPGMSPAEARAWAREADLECIDEHLLHPDPYPTREAWCAARCALSEARLATALERHAGPVLLIDHFPLRPELAVLPAIPRFKIWCGTTRTADWVRKYRASVVIYGHLHIRGTTHLDGVRFEEVSLGYPKQWARRAPAGRVPRQILPAP